MNSATGEPALFPLEVSPDRVLLGALTAGQSATGKFTLLNPGSCRAAVARFETSCPCLTVAEQRITVEPGQTVDLLVKFDPTHAPDFRGGLSVSVIGRDAAGGIAFATCAVLEVRTQGTTNPAN